MRTWWRHVGVAVPSPRRRARLPQHDVADRRPRSGTAAGDRLVLRALSTQDSSDTLLAAAVRYGRIRHDRVDLSDMFTLRHDSRLHHIGTGRRHAGTDTLVLVHDLDIRALPADGELIRERQLEPTRDWRQCK